MHIALKRIYDQAEEEDGTRILVDRLWPRGVKKEEASLDGWWKSLAPSDELRKWFGHDPDKWSEFKKRYRKELQDHRSEAAELLEGIDKRKKVTFLYGAKDETHNQAVVLREFVLTLSK